MSCYASQCNTINEHASQLHMLCRIRLWCMHTCTCTQTHACMPAGKVMCTIPPPFQSSAHPFSELLPPLLSILTSAKHIERPQKVTAADSHLVERLGWPGSAPAMSCTPLSRQPATYTRPRGRAGTGAAAPPRAGALHLLSAAEHAPGMQLHGCLAVIFGVLCDRNATGIC